MPSPDNLIGLAPASEWEYLIYLDLFKRNEFQIIQENPPTVSNGMRKHTVALYGDYRIILLKTDMGKVDAAASSQWLIDQYHPKVIIGLGVVGSLDGEKLPAGSVVMFNNTLEWDQDWSAMGDRQPTIITPPSGTIYERVKEVLGSQVVHGCVITGDTFLNDAQKQTELRKQYGAIAIDMETAALSKVCQRNGVIFIGLKAASDTPSSLGTKNAWEQVESNLPDAVKNSFYLLKKLFDERVFDDDNSFQSPDVTSLHASR